MKMKAPSVYQHLFSLIMPISITLIIPWWIHPVLLNEYFFLKCIGIIIGLVGLFGFIYTVYLFRVKGRGTLAPWTPTQQLVIEGPYRYCRNPMIASVLFILIGETLFFPSSSLAVEAVLFFIFNTVYFIFSEEPGLEQRFGKAYVDYKKKVPRWIGW